MNDIFSSANIPKIEISLMLPQKKPFKLNAPPFYFFWVSLSILMTLWLPLTWYGFSCVLNCGWLYLILFIIVKQKSLVLKVLCKAKQHHSYRHIFQQIIKVNSVIKYHATCVCVCVSRYVLVFVCQYVFCVCVSWCVCVCACVSVCLSVYICECLRVCVCVCFVFFIDYNVLDIL